MTHKPPFYAHLVDLEALHVRIERLGLSEPEKVELLTIVDNHIHTAILDLILSELSEDDKRMFLTHMIAENQGEIWTMLKKKIDAIEEKIQKTVEQLRDELHADIDEIENEDKKVK